MSPAETRPRTATFLLLTATASAAVYTGMIRDGGLAGPRALEWTSLLMWMPGLWALVCLGMERISWKRIGWDPGDGRDLFFAAILPIALHAALLAAAVAVGLVFFSKPWFSANIPRLARLVLIVPFALGEELGWRAYLQPRLTRRFGERTAIILVGLLWGYWHFPLIWLGYNFPRHPTFGAFVLMPILCVGWSGFLGRLYIRTESVWVPTIAHAAINASFWMLAEIPAAPSSWIELVPVAAWLAIGAISLLRLAPKKSLLAHPSNK